MGKILVTGASGNVGRYVAEELLKMGEMIVCAGKSKTSFVDAADVGLAVATLLHSAEKYQNTAHIITGPEAMNYYQIAEILSAVTGRKICYAKPGFCRYRRYYIENRGFAKAYINVTVALYFMTRMGTAKAVTDGFYRLTGEQPRTFLTFAQANKLAFM